jgi:putative ABC transport system substrate-binding protein
MIRAAGSECRSDFRQFAGARAGRQELGWTDGRNVRIDYRWTAGDPEHARRYAAELVALAPDVILAVGGAVVPPLLQVTRTVPIVFTQTPRSGWRRLRQ